MTVPRFGAAEALSAIGIAQLELSEPLLDGTFGVGHRPLLAPLIRPAFEQGAENYTDHPPADGCARLPSA